jgi:hypothetical protein
MGDRLSSEIFNHASLAAEQGAMVVKVKGL